LVFLLINRCLSTFLIKKFRLRKENNE
jgi:hypothetical protein